MTSIAITQSTFSKGICSESISARDDTDILVKSAYDIQNFVLTAQGGLKKRHGIQSIVSLSNQGNIIFCQSLKIANGVNVHLYQLDGNSALYIILNNSYQSFVSDFGIISSFTVSENNILFAPQYKELKITGPSSYTISDFIIKKPLFLYTPSGTPSTIRFTLVGAASVDYFHIGSKVQFTAFTLGTPPAYIFANGLNIECLTLDQGIVVEGSETGVRAELISGTSEYGFTIETEYIDFFIQQWDDDNTSPPYLTIYNNRLFVGKNNNIWASEINNTGNFVQLSADDDQPFRMTLDNNVNVTGLFVYKTLLTFTNLGIHAYLNSLTGAMTATNNVLSKISDHIPLTSSSSNNMIIPTFMDNSLFYIEKNTFHVRQLSFSPSANQVIGIDTMRFIKDRINTGIYNIVSTNSINNENGDSFLFAIQNTGVIFCYQSIATDDINGWTRLIFNEPITHLSTIDNDLYFFSNEQIYQFTTNYLDPNNTQIIPSITLNDISGLSPVGSLRFKRKKISDFNIQLFTNYVDTQIKINNQEFNLHAFDNSIFNHGLLYKLLTKITDNYEFFKFINIEFPISNDLELLGIEYSCEVEV